MSSSANCSSSMPSSSCLLNWMPAPVSMSMESCAYMSSLRDEGGERSDVGGEKGVGKFDQQINVYIYLHTMLRK